MGPKSRFVPEFQAARHEFGAEAIHGLERVERAATAAEDEALGVLALGPRGFVRFEARNGRWITGPFDPDQLLFCNYIDACALYRRSVWEQNHGYDGTMPVQGFEDWDFWLGALEHGWQFAYMPEVLFEYRYATGSMITRTRGFESQVEAFVATKHGFLYRQAWRQLEQDHISVKRTCQNLGRLLKSRFREKFLTPANIRSKIQEARRNSNRAW